jgi:hypothetical protein
MHGVPEDLDLSIFVNKTLALVGIGEFQMSFHFHPDGLLTVEGDWELIGEDGSVVDRSIPNEERTELRVQRLLGQLVVSSQIDPPRSFSLRFGNGLVLRVFDNSPQYESFSIQPGDIHV